MEVWKIIKIINDSVLPYGVKSFPYLKTTDHCRYLATNSQQDVNVHDKEGIFNRVTCSVDELEARDGVDVGGG